MGGGDRWVVLAKDQHHEGLITRGLAWILPDPNDVLLPASVHQKAAVTGLDGPGEGDCVRTALLVVDPYNDFVSRRGKGWPLIREVAGEVGLVANLRAAIGAARARDVPVIYAPHRRYRRKDGARPRYATPNQDLARLTRFFDDGGFGRRFHRDLEPAPGEFVASEHRVSSGFGGTDLDDHLRRIEVDHLVVCGLLTNTCIESTVRQGVDLGYHVAVLTDAVAAWTRADHSAAIGGALRHVAHRLLTTREFAS